MSLEQYCLCLLLLLDVAVLSSGGFPLLARNPFTRNLTYTEVKCVKHHTLPFVLLISEMKHVDCGRLQFVINMIISHTHTHTALS